MRRSEQWVKSAEYRMESARVLVDGKQYLDAVFHCQQAIEMMLKAILSEQNNEDPPREHDLLLLISRLAFSLPSVQKKIIDELHDVSVPLRYPDDFFDAMESYDEVETRRIYKETEELLAWLKQKLN